MEECKNSSMILDCTLRDGGYYNDWDFPASVVAHYLQAMVAANVDIVELGLRSLKNTSFLGASAFTSDEYLRSLAIPASLKVSVMVNASEFVADDVVMADALATLFPEHAAKSPVDVVRIACHVHEFAKALPASSWLKERGFIVGFNLMQVADRSQEEVEALAFEANRWPLDVLYFADSMGSMKPEQVRQLITWFRKHWHGAMGIHTHDNMGHALANTMCATDNGVQWLDATVTGMGRGPGNAKTEYLVLELADRAALTVNLVPLMGLIESYFKPLQQKCGWGTNAYYYLAGKYGIHPTYIQEMLGDSRYSEEDVFAVINHLRVEGGKKFNFKTLDAARNFYQGTARGTWCPQDILMGREVLLLGAGPGVEAHKAAIESYICSRSPYVIALNTQSKIDSDLIDARVACHPVRLLADCVEHSRLPQPLITPASMLPEELRRALGDKSLYDFGITIEAEHFGFAENHCVLPNSLVFSYALAIAASGKAKRIYLAGFDGYGADDPRSKEVQATLDLFQDAVPNMELTAVTPSRYVIRSKSIYAI